FGLVQQSLDVRPLDVDDVVRWLALSGQADPRVDPAATERVDQYVTALGQPLGLPPEQLGVELRRLLGFWSVALEPRDGKSHHRPPSREGSTLPNMRNPPLPSLGWPPKPRLDPHAGSRG